MTTFEIPPSLSALFELAADSGLDLCYSCLDDTWVEAGRTDKIDRTVADINVMAAAACDRVLALVGSRSRWEYQGVCPSVTITWIRIGARIASFLMPAVTVDMWDRFTVTPDDDGYWPDPSAFDRALFAAVEALGAYVQERDRNEWVDPYVMAGAVADIHDAARAMSVLFEVTASEASQ